MKSSLLTLFLSIYIPCLLAQSFTDITLPQPEKTGGKPLMEALSDRQTRREFSNKEFNLQEISNLLWAAYGINRSENGKRTAPSAMNRQEIDLYVSIKSGVYLYDAQNNKLKAVADGDHRKDMGTQSFVGEASLVLVYVADFSRMSEKTTPERKQFYAGTDTGFISQNVYLYAASENLATVVLGSFNSDTIGKIIPLSKDQKITLTQAIGFPK